MQPEQEHNRMDCKRSGMETYLGRPPPGASRKSTMGSVARSSGMFHQALSCQLVKDMITGFGKLLDRYWSGDQRYPAV